MRPFTRCMVCNGRLDQVDRARIAVALPAGVLRTQDRFWRCSACHRTYWRGSHYRRLLGELKRLCAPSG